MSSTKRKSKKVRHPKQDPKLVAAKDKAEVAYVTSRHKHATQKIVREVCAVAGRSRGKVYAELKKRGYELKPLKRKSK